MWGAFSSNTYTEIETQYTTTIYSHFRDIRIYIHGQELEVYTYRYTCIYLFTYSKDIPVEIGMCIYKKALISCSLT